MLAVFAASQVNLKSRTYLKEETMRSILAEELGNYTGVVMFGASWCMPCRSAKPKVERLSDSSKVPVAYFDIDDGQYIAQSLGIQSVPTFIRYQNGTPTGARLIGANDEGLNVLFGV
jgi:thioredoxin-like negative regulator of GroEL